MKKVNQVKQEQENFMKLIRWMVSPDEAEEANIRSIIEENGVKALFLNIIGLDVSDDVKSKLFDLRNIIVTIDGDLSKLDDVKGGE